MARNHNTDRNGNAWTFDQKLAVWRRAKQIPGYEETMWRWDKCGHMINWSQHGNRQSEYGWEIDHINPVANNGNDNIENLQALYWKFNAEKGDSLTWNCPIR